MTPAELVGLRLHEARVAARLSQRRLGEMLGPYLGVQWSPQAVSSAEKGRRRFDVSELFALSTVLHRPVTWFVLPDDPDQSFEMPGTLPALGSGVRLLLADADIATLRTLLIGFAERTAEAVARLEDALAALKPLSGLARSVGHKEELRDQVEAINIRENRSGRSDASRDLAARAADIGKGKDAPASPGARRRGGH